MTQDETIRVYGQTCMLAYNEYLKEVRREMLKLANGASKEANNCLCNQLGEALRSYMADKLPEETAMLLWAGE